LIPVNSKSSFPMLAQLVLLTCLAVAVSQAPFEFTGINSTFSFSWSVSGTPAVLNGKISVTLASWVGIGWHSFGSTGADDKDMFDVDFVIGVFNAATGSVTVTDRKSNDATNSGKTQPLLDTAAAVGGVDNIISSNGVQTASSSVVSFTRLLDTKDTKGDFPLTSSGYYHVIIAHGKDNTIGYHGNTNRGHILVNFVTGASMACNATTCP